MPSSPSALASVADVLRDRGWVQGEYCKDEGAGAAYGPVCLMAAIYVAAGGYARASTDGGGGLYPAYEEGSSVSIGLDGDYQVFFGLQDQVYDRLPASRHRSSKSIAIIEWNDKEDRTLEEVLYLLEREDDA